MRIMAVAMSGLLWSSCAAADEAAREDHRDCLAAVAAQQGFGAELAVYGHEVEPGTAETLSRIRTGFERLALDQLGCPIAPLLAEAEATGLDLQFSYEDRIDPETTTEIWEDGIARINDCILARGEAAFVEAATREAPPPSDICATR